MRRPNCTACGGRSTHVAFVDESVRGGTYILVGVCICRCCTEMVRREMQRHRRPGQRRVHFSKASDRDRKAVLSVIAAMSITIIYERSRGRETTARSVCWSRLVPQLVTHGVGELVIERLVGAEQRDRRDISRALSRLGSISPVRYDHVDASAEAALWVADAAAWALGKGGGWADRIRPRLGP